MEQNTNVKEIVDQLCERKKELEVFTKCVQDLNRLIPTLEDLKEINPKLQKEKDEFGQLEKQMMGLEKEYQDLQTRYASLREQVPVLQVELARLKAEKGELERIIKSHREDMPELEPKDLEELKAQIDHLKDRIKYISSSGDQKEYFFKIIEDLLKEITTQ